MAAIGNLLKGAGYIVFIGAGLWGFFLCIGIIAKAAGFWGIVAALFLAPITFLAAPLYAGFVLEDWFPLILNYGGGVLAMALIGTGSAMSGDR